MNTFGAAEVIGDPIERNNVLDGFALACTNDHLEFMLNRLSTRYKEDGMTRYVGRVLLDNKTINYQEAMQKLAADEAGEKAVLAYMAELSAVRLLVK